MSTLRDSDMTKEAEFGVLWPKTKKTKEDRAWFYS